MSFCAQGTACYAGITQLGIPLLYCNIIAGVPPIVGYACNLETNFQKKKKNNTKIIAVFLRLLLQQLILNNRDRSSNCKDAGSYYNSI